MARARKKAEADDLLDGILGEPTDEFDTDTSEDSGEKIRVEVTPEDDSEDEAEKPAKLVDEKPAEADPEDDEDDSEEEPLAAKAKPTEAVEEDGDEEVDEAEKRNRGLLKEITELRRKLSAAQQQSSTQPVAPVAPPAASTTAQPADKPKGRLQVVVDENGKEVYGDLEQARDYLKQIVNEEYENRSRPTPAQIKIFENQRATEEFVAADRERNAPVAERAQQADDYLTAQLETLAAEGYQFRSAREASALLRHRGIDTQTAEYFPELAPMFDEFIAGMASGDPIWRRSILERMSPAIEAKQPAPPPLKSVKGLPPSLAKRGGSRSTSPNSDESEFEALRDEFKKDVAFFPDEKYERLQSLGRKLEKPGFDGD